MLRFIFFLLYLPLCAQAHLWIQSSDLSTQDFQELRLRHSGESFSDWLRLKDQKGFELNMVLNSGEELLSQQISTSDFLSLVDQRQDEVVLNSEARQAIIDTLLKRMEIESGSLQVFWDEICFYFHWDEDIQKRWPQFQKKCHVPKKMISIQKPDWLHDETLTVNGSLWNQQKYFYQRSRPNARMHLKVYSNRFFPLVIKTKDLKVLPLPRENLISGNCQNPFIEAEKLQKMDIPLLQTQVAFEKNCFQLAAESPKNVPSHFWKRNQNWLWTAAILGAGFLVYHARDKEIELEWP